MPIEDIWIGDREYPCDEWASIESGEVKNEDWEVGFDGGIGEFSRRSQNGLYTGTFLDVTSPPYARMVAPVVTTAITGGDPSKPVYGFYIESNDDGDPFAYILNGQFGYKIDLANGNTLEDKYDFGANAVCGRPSLFNGEWYIALGDTVNAVKLNPANVVDDTEGADTFTGLSYKARHFAVLPPVDTTGLCRLARAYETNMVAYSSDGTTWADGFEVGEGSLPINELLCWVGELLAIRADGPWKFDDKGNARRYQSLLDLGQKSLTPKKAGNADPYEGSNSLVHGMYGYWVDAAGIYRLLGEGLLPAGFESADDYVNLNLTTGVLLKDNQAWTSATAFGRYIYATNSAGLWQGRQDGDGMITWLSCMLPTGTLWQRCVVTEGPSNPILWRMLSTTAVQSFNLNPDGSTRADLGDARGGVGWWGTGWLPLVSFGNLKRQKQLRFLWAIAEGLDADNTLTMGYILERGKTETYIGSTYVTDGTHIAEWTVGSNDLCYEMRPVFRLNQSAIGTPADPRIRAFGVQAVTPQVYRAVVPLREDRMAGRMSVADALKTLRGYKNAGPVAVREPGFRGSFQGYVESIAEQTRTDKDGQRQHTLTLFIQRFDWSDDA